MIRKVGLLKLICGVHHLWCQMGYVRHIDNGGLRWVQMEGRVSFASLEASIQSTNHLYLLGEVSTYPSRSNSPMLQEDSEKNHYPPIGNHTRQNQTMGAGQIPTLLHPLINQMDGIAFVGRRLKTLFPHWIDTFQNWLTSSDLEMHYIDLEIHL